MLRLLWIAGISLVLRQNAVPDELSIVNQGTTVAKVNRGDYSLPATPLIDPAKLDSLLDNVERQTFRLPRDAEIGNHGGIVAEQPGYRLDRAGFTHLFHIYFYGSGTSSMEVPLKLIYPKVDSELLAYLREKPIGHYVTYFNAGNKNRSRNIALAAKAINNQVVFPNETFSFNQIVGQRNEKKGYVRAPVIVRGELSEGIGGGICQVSSTLFNAVDRAGLLIVKRYSHSRHVPYVLPGRDATVSWGGPDFAFRNPYNQPILIRAFASGGRMFISIYSSEVIDYRPRAVPGTSKRLPEEISIETGSPKRN
ncbi:VanW family protein [Cohnella faecalis]|uniref:Peptidoglycan binding domain-containing protein n=1 Tax=Cohnella faecalis TaxID=2315694 RepID=A0A398D260_9BACL|nr:VanW family protein [Cohnella faecalis]RIE05194.1 hypothetical protein D3H35_02150 [Cohnella faecalis]